MEELATEEPDVNVGIRPKKGTRTCQPEGEKDPFTQRNSSLSPYGDGIPAVPAFDAIPTPLCCKRLRARACRPHLLERRVMIVARASHLKGSCRLERAAAGPSAAGLGTALFQRSFHIQLGYLGR